jgi:hypothetical protein
MNNKMRQDDKFFVAICFASIAAVIGYADSESALFAFGNYLAVLVTLTLVVWWQGK